MRERHELDEAHHHVAFCPKRAKSSSLVVVHAAHHHCVDLDGMEACLDGGIDAVEHLG
jgi:hypothetical protein